MYYSMNGSGFAGRGHRRMGEYFSGLGEEPDAAGMGSATTWAAGGILLGLAVVLFAAEKKGFGRA